MHLFYKMDIIGLTGLFIILFHGTVAMETYEGSVVLAVSLDESNIAEFNQLTDQYQLDIWKEARVPGDESHIMVSDDQMYYVTQYLNYLKINWRIHINNLEEVIRNERKRFEERHRTVPPENRAYDYSTFNEFSEFLPELEALAAECPDGFQCDVYSIGQSYEGNELNVLRISKPGESDRKGIWLEAMMHAREWLAGATHMSMAQKLVREYGRDEEATLLMDGYDWYLLPVANPDGYIYTWTNERLWRKNRTPNEGSQCIGTDLNRNYEYRWGEVGSSSEPCSSTFCGVAPASEPVTQHLQAVMTDIGGSLTSWITLHTYGQYWLTSWAYTENSPESGGPCAEPDDYEDLLAVAQAAATAAGDTHGDTWEAGSWCTTLYDSSGVLQDHAKATGGIKYTFTPELRGGSFMVDDSEIPLSLEEVWNALVAMVVAIEVQN